jgi:hypothetical protein
VVEEQRFSEPADERAPVGDDIGERLIGRDHTEIEIDDEKYLIMREDLGIIA